MYVLWCIILEVFLLIFHFLLAVKAGGMRVPKKQENGPVEKNAKPLGKDKSRYYNAMFTPALWFKFIGNDL